MGRIYPFCRRFETVDDLKSYLSRHFTESYIQTKFLENADIYYVSDNGNLYFITNWGKGFYDLWRDTLLIEQIEEGRYRVGIRGGVLEEYHDDLEYGYEYYEVVYDDDAYKIASVLS